MSGGVDSTVTAVLITKIIGPENVQCLFLDTGLLRKNEFHEVLEELSRRMNLNVQGISSGRHFSKKFKRSERS